METLGPSILFVNSCLVGLCVPFYHFPLTITFTVKSLSDQITLMKKMLLPSRNPYRSHFLYFN